MGELHLRIYEATNGSIDRPFTLNFYDIRHRVALAGARLDSLSILDYYFARQTKYMPRRPEVA